MPKISKNKIVFDGEDWLSDVDYLSTSSSYQRGSTNLVQANSFDPVREYGYAQPGFLPADATNIASITGALKTGLKAAADTAYAISVDGKVHKITGLSGNGTISVAAPFPYSITVANSVGSDMVAYNVGTTPYLFYSYYTAALWDVGSFDLTATFNDTYMTATATSPLAAPYIAGGATYPHPMIVGDNNILYIGDRNYVHAFNGQVTANGTFYPAVLTLPSNYLITALVNYQFYLVIYAYKVDSTGSNLSESKAFFWDTFSSSFTFVKDLNANIVTEAINYRDTMACFVLGNNEGFYRTTGTFQIFDGSNFVVVKKGINVPSHGGAQVVGDNLFWLGDGAMYAYRGLGNKKYIHEIFTEGMAGARMLRSFTNTYNLHFSTGSGAGAGLRSFRQNFYSPANAITKVVEPEFPEYMQGKIKSITVTYQKATSGGRSFTLDCLTDAVSNNVISNKTTVTNLIERYERYSNANSFNLFKQLQISLSWGAGLGSSSAPAISRIEVEFDLVNIINN
jgi:hypothetical protein